MGRQATWSRHPVHADSEVKGKLPPKAKTKGGASGAVSSNVEPAQPAKAKGNDKGKAKATSESCSVAAQPLECCLAAQPLQWHIVRDGKAGWKLQRWSLLIKLIAKEIILLLLLLLLPTIATTYYY